MTSSTIKSLIAKKILDPQTKQPISFNIKQIIIEKDILAEIAEKIIPLGLGNKVLIIDDENVKAISLLIEESLRGGFLVKKFTLPDSYKPYMDYSLDIMKIAKGFDFMIACGSGSLNDIVKYAAFLSDKPYISCPTAPSANGYASAAASLVKDNIKTSFPAKQPLAIYFDLTIAELAPIRLIKSGFADSLARSTAQADNILSHLFLETPYQEIIFELQEAEEEILFSRSKFLIDRDSQAIEALCNLLILSGLGMAYSGSSAPASGFEHTLAHVLECLYPAQTSELYHGELIAITTAFYSKIQDQFLLSPSQLEADDYNLKQIEQFLNGKLKLGNEVLSYQEGLNLSVELFNKKIKDKWKLLQSTISRNHIFRQGLFEFYKQLKLETSPQLLGLDNETLQEISYYACFSRNRLSFADLARLSKKI